VIALLIEQSPDNVLSLQDSWCRTPLQIALRYKVRDFTLHGIIRRMDPWAVREHPSVWRRGLLVRHEASRNGAPVEVLDDLIKLWPLAAPLGLIAQQDSEKMIL
jgi:hypothetical protein